MNVNLKSLLIILVIFTSISLFSNVYAQTENSFDTSNLQNTESISEQNDLKVNDDYCKSLEPINYRTGFDLSTIGEIDSKTGSYELIFWQTFVSDVDFTKCPPPSDWDYTNGYVIAKGGINTEPNFHKFKIHGVFFSDFDYRNYPFEKLNLSVHLEPYYPITAENMIFTIDEQFSNADGSRLTVPGWTVGELVYESRVDQYPWADFPHYSVQIPLESPPSSVFLKKILPALVLGVFGFTTFLFSSKRLDERATIVGAGMVGAIFFHSVYLLGELPPLGYLTIADKIMLSIYSIFGMSVIGIVLHQRHQNKLDKMNLEYDIVEGMSIDKRLMKVTPIVAASVFISLYFLG